MVHAFSFSFTVVHIKTQKPPTFTDYRTLTLYYVVYVADASARAAAHAHCAARRNAKEWWLVPREQGPVIFFMPAHITYRTVTK